MVLLAVDVFVESDLFLVFCSIHFVFQTLLNLCMILLLQIQCEKKGLSAMDSLVAEIPGNDSFSGTHQKVLDAPEAFPGRKDSSATLERLVVLIETSAALSLTAWDPKLSQKKNSMEMFTFLFLDLKHVCFLTFKSWNDFIKRWHLHVLHIQNTDACDIIKKGFEPI